MEDNKSLEMHLERAGARSMQNVLSTWLKVKLLGVALVLVFTAGASLYYFLCERSHGSAIALFAGVAILLALLANTFRTQLTLLLSRRVEKLYRKREDSGKSNRPFKIAFTTIGVIVVAVMTKSIWQPLWDTGLVEAYNRGWLPSFLVLLAGIACAVYTAMTMSKSDKHSATRRFDNEAQETAITKKLMWLYGLAAVAPVLCMLFLGLSSWFMTR
ncbi:hypothetical protein KO498_13705 [Lentibacter algarum]|uniref:hypothetical protein n=1 Tax=Lentibacter algarum TaxID=576131 RepID=UPI001C091E26|nr:hypothetical protein [Lentibacter algarum]MBU2982868.1 hypothetical protein [Lentibacter algarum]